MEVIKQGVILKMTEKDLETLDKAYDILYDLKVFGSEYEDQEGKTFNHLAVDLSDLYEACDTLETVYRHFKNECGSIVIN